MYLPEIKLRRARRTDFVALMRILASNNLAVPPPERAALRRFRRLVADLGIDIYVAVVAEQVVGFVHVAYSRQIAGAPKARMEALAVQEDYHRRGIASLLVDLACRLARRRGSDDLRCETARSAQGFRNFLMKKGWSQQGDVLWYPVG